MIVSGYRNRASAAQGAVAGLIIAGLLRSRSRSSDGFALRMGSELEVDGIEAQQHLTTLDRLAGIHQPLQHLARHPKAQVALNTSRDDTGEGARPTDRHLDGGNTHQRRFSAGIGGCLIAAGDQRKRHHADESGQKEVAPAHEEPVAKS